MVQSYHNTLISCLIVVGALPVGRQFFLGNMLQTILSGVRCNGAESKLVNCPSSMVPAECPVQQTNAGVICQDISTLVSNCSDGDVRLVNGSSVLEGRVEVCLNDAWGTVCDTRFNEDVATVICRQLNFPFNGKKISKQCSFCCSQMLINFYTSL